MDQQRSSLPIFNVPALQGVLKMCKKEKKLTGSDKIEGIMLEHHSQQESGNILVMIAHHKQMPPANKKLASL